VLLPQGAALTDPALSSLRRRGIDRVQVEDAAVDAAQLAAERERVERRLAHLYRHGTASPAAAQLRAQLCAYRLEGLS
jgi:hypothetical protein